MPPPFGRGAAAPPWWAAAARWMLCAVFLATAFGKLLDNRGFAQALGDYRLFPAPLLLPLGLAVSLAELAVAAGLAHPASVRPAALGALALGLGNALLLSLTLVRGIALENCGCFGAFLARPLTAWTPLEDVALAALAVMAWRGHAPRRPAAAPGGSAP